MTLIDGCCIDAGISCDLPFPAVAREIPVNWSQLLNDGRRKYKNQPVVPPLAGETRTPIEHDYDRVLFSTPVRRLADKTQVFPLEKNDSVRTRLTHSLKYLIWRGASALIWRLIRT